jgi:hypothetical protein
VLKLTDHRNGQVDMTEEERRQKIYTEINSRAALMAREREDGQTKSQQPLTFLQRFIAWGLAIILLIGVITLPSLLIVGLLYVFGNGWSKRQQLPNDEFLVEYIKVAGECAEDHVKDSAPYTGSIEHSRNVTTGDHSGSGYVIHRRDYTDDAWTERLSDPYRYEPPFTITFTNLRPAELQGEILHLTGVSNFLADEESRRPTYRATCTLRVTRRLDHRPSQPEEIAQ